MGISKTIIKQAITLSFFAASSLAFAQGPAQTPTPAQGGWRRVTDAPPAPDQQTPPPDQVGAPGGPQDQTPPPPPPPQGANAPNYNPNYGQNGPNYGPNGPNYGPNGPNYGPNGQNYPPPPPVPAVLTIKPGTFITVRVNQPISSDRNQVGDTFTASLSRPLVVDGVVVAQRGQLIAGRVTEAKKAGRVEGVSRLGIQLTQLTLVDGNQAPIQTQMVNRSGPSSVGRDAAAVGGTTALGAAAGAAADWGRGAAIGAGAGAAVGLVGVLLTRGHPTVIFPESELTFQIQNPVTVNTDRAPDAFRYVDPNDYERNNRFQTGAGPYGPRPAAACGPYGCPPPAPYYAPYPRYYAPGFAYYYGPGLFYGPSFYFGRGGYYRAYRR